MHGLLHVVWDKDRIGSSTLGVEMKCFPRVTVTGNVFTMLLFSWQRVVRVGGSQMSRAPPTERVERDGRR